MIKSIAATAERIILEDLPITPPHAAQSFTFPFLSRLWNLVNSSSEASAWLNGGASDPLLPTEKRPSKSYPLSALGTEDFERVLPESPG